MAEPLNQYLEVVTKDVYNCLDKKEWKTIGQIQKTLENRSKTDEIQGYAKALIIEDSLDNLISNGHVEKQKAREPLYRIKQRNEDITGCLVKA